MAAHLTSMTIYLEGLKRALKDSKQPGILFVHGSMWGTTEVQLMKNILNQLRVSLTEGMRANERILAAINELEEAIINGGSAGENYATDAFNRNLETSIEKLEASILKFSQESSITIGLSAPVRGTATASESKIEHEKKEDAPSIELLMGKLSKEPYTHDSEMVKLNDEGEIDIDDDFLKRFNDMGPGAFAIITAGEDLRAQESDLIGLLCSQEKGNRQIHVKDGALWVRSEDSENGPYKNFDSLYEGMKLDRSKGLTNSKASPEAKELESVGELKVSAKITSIARTAREMPFKSAFGSNTTERRDNFLRILKEYDKGDSYVSDNISGYLFYKPRTSTYFANKQIIDVPGPFFNRELIDIQDSLQHLCFSDDKAEREMAQKIVASEYKIHLMPKTEYTRYVIEKLLKLFDGDPELRKLIMTFKVLDSSLTTSMSLTKFGINIMPRVVIYPILGKENAEKLLHAIYNSFTPEEMIEIGLGITPRYNTPVGPLMYYSQGGGDFKGKTLFHIGKENKARLITDTGAHFVWGERLFKPGARSAPMLAEGSLPAVESKVEREHKLLGEAELAAVAADVRQKTADGSDRDQCLSDTALIILGAIIKVLPEKDQRWIETNMTTKHEKLTMSQIFSLEINAMIKELVPDRSITDLTLKTIETLKQFIDPEKQKQFIDEFIKRLQLIKAYDAQEKLARQVENAPAAPGVPESKPTIAAAKAIEDSRAARNALETGRAGDDTEEPGSTPTAGL